jgi:hypothetical protein
VQRAGVRAGGADAAVADVVAVDPGPQPEDALQPALARLAGPRQRAHDVLEAGDRRVDGVLELRDLVLVLDQPQLGQERDSSASAASSVSNSRSTRGS